MSTEDYTINSLWFKDIKKEEDKGQLKAEVLAAAKVLERLQEMLEIKIKQTEKASEAREGYNVPNWPYLQADYIASIRTYKAIKDLIQINQRTVR